MTTKDIGDFFELETPSGKTGTSYLLAIGINEYQQPKVPRLYNAVRDAKKLVTVLTSKYQFDKANVTELINEAATEENILQEIDNLIDKATEADNVIIYFSGHGAFRENVEQGYWVPVEGRFNSAASTISNSTLTDHLKAIKARHLVLIVDACFGGSLIQQNRGSSLAVKTADDDYYQEIYQIPSRWLFTSGRKEPVTDGTPGQHSPFANHLLNTLKENQTPCLPIQELGRKVAVAVNKEGYDQLPFSGAWNISDQHQGGEFIFQIMRDPGTALAGKEWEMVVQQLSFWKRIPKKIWRQIGVVLVAWAVFLGFLYWQRAAINDWASPETVPEPTTGIPPITLVSGNRTFSTIDTEREKTEQQVVRTTAKPSTTTKIVVIPNDPPLGPVAKKEPEKKPGDVLISDPPPPVIIQVNKPLIPLRSIEKGDDKSFDFVISRQNPGSALTMRMEFDEKSVEITSDQQFLLEHDRPVKITATLHTADLPVGAYQSTIEINGGKGQTQTIKITANIIEATCPVHFIGVSPGATVSVAYLARVFEGKDTDKKGKVTLQIPKKLINNQRCIQVTTSTGQSAKWTLQCDQTFEF